MDGEDGYPGMVMAGGGGSGGSVMLSAGGSVLVGGRVAARGGSGGNAERPGTREDPKDGQRGHGGGGGGGRIAIDAQAVTLTEDSRVDVSGGTSRRGDGRGDGQDGTTWIKEELGHDLYIDSTQGAMGTSRSLFLRHKEVIESDSGNDKRTPVTRNGPEFRFGEKGRPGRAQFFVKLGAEDADATESSSSSPEAKMDGWGTVFELREEQWLDFPDSQQRSNDTAVVGIFIGKTMMHGSGYYSNPGDSGGLKDDRNPAQFADYVRTGQWYKIDIRLDWLKRTYSVYLDDVLKVDMSPFVGGGVSRLGLSTYHAVSAWYDEIYVGVDATMNFKCPTVTGSGLEMTRPVQTGWKKEDIGGWSTNHKMQRHESHMSNKPLYARVDSGGLVAFDGEGHQKFNSDIKFRFSDGDHRETRGKVNAGTLLQMEEREVGESMWRRSVSSNTQGENSWSAGAEKDAEAELGATKRFIWYGEHENVDLDEREGYTVGGNMRGGVSACSTNDFITWRNEGTMLHLSNLTDMVTGTLGPFRIERPKVIYNNRTDKFVMWMTIDDENRTLGMAGVAVSDYANGPFDFIRSFYPDGNETHDQTLHQDEQTGDAYLIRTYYATVDYVLPASVMQPLWESVKNADGTINFGLSYHRANYEPAYDDFHDIYLQRWRNEDKPWEVICVNRETKQERIIEYGMENNNFDEEVCDDPSEYKLVKGQGNPLSEQSGDGVKTRFLNPLDPLNSVWRQTSVPSVKAQPWNTSYRDGTCGMRKLDNDMGFEDPDLGDREIGGREECSNIVDNAVHPTRPDKLIGEEVIVEQRKAKYVAISKLSDDYLDTSGIVTSFEGELENEVDLVSLLTRGAKEGKFGWDYSNEELGSTFKEQVYTEFKVADNWDTRFHQYEVKYNDRAYYSLSCKLDGNCPVNFKDQVEQYVGHV